MPDQLDSLPVFPAGFISPQLVSEDGMNKQVWKAFNVLTKSWSILKRFWDQPTEDMLAEELRTLGKLNHRNIVRQEEPVFINGDVWIIEEILDQTFEKLSPMEHRYAFGVYAQQLADALEYLHDPAAHGGKSFIHGDIHLRNCGLIRGVAKLFDFGKATYAGSTGTTRRGFICTRAPEQFDGGAQPETTLDIWAYGCTLFALRTGEYPFVLPDENQKHDEAIEVKDRETITAIETETLRRVSSGLTHEIPRRHFSMFDADLWSIIDRMLQPDSSKRISASELENLLSIYRDNAAEIEATADADTEINLARTAAKSMARGEVDDLPWFREAVNKSLANNN